MAKKRSEAGNSPRGSDDGGGSKKSSAREEEFVPPPKPRREQIGPNVFPSGDEGEEVVVHIPSMTISPVSYNTFTVGGHIAKTTVRPGENRLDAMRRAYADLEIFVREEGKLKFQLFIETYNGAKRALKRGSDDE